MHQQESKRIFWNDSRLRRLSTASLFGVLLALLIHVAFSSSPASILTEGDFPGFYSPALTVYEGNAERLYDFDYQKELQNKFWPDAQGGYYISVYPPYFCALLAPLGALSPQWAKAALTLLMFICFLWALRIASSFVPLFRTHYFECAVTLFLFPPLFYGILAAQNTALSLLLYTAAIYFFLKKTPSGDAKAGFLLGLWLFKPQYGLPAIALLIVAGRYKALIGAAIAVVCYYVLGAAVLGFHWPVLWYKAATQFGSVNYDINGFQMLSFIGAFHSLSHFFPAQAALFLKYFSIGLTAGVALAAAWQFRTIRSTGANREENGNLLTALLRVGPALLLINPQTLFYDLGIAVIACAFYIRLRSDREVNGILVLWLLSAIATVIRNATAFPVLFLFSLGAFIFIWTRGEPQLQKYEQ